jgi:uncharacterized protein
LGKSDWEILMSKFISNNIHKIDKIIVHSGRMFNYSNLDSNVIDIEEIAHHLSIENRFGGATIFPYSVAQHSVIVAKNLPPKYQMLGLLHDAHEAYCKDVNPAIKNKVQSWQEFEDEVQDFVLKGFGYDFFELARAKIVKVMDFRALMTEKRDLLLPCQEKWDDYWLQFQPFDEPIEEKNWKVAKREFLEMFYKLKEIQ